MNSNPFAFEDLCLIAAGLLEGYAANGEEAERNALIWNTGIRIRYAPDRKEDPLLCTDAKEWTPTPGYYQPGNANYDEALNAENEARITYTVEYTGAVEYMVWKSETDTIAFDACKQLISKLTKQKTELPATLADWQNRYMSDEIKCPRKPGRKKATNEPRNFRIAQAVYSLAALPGVTPTRNDASNHNSACDAVARASELTYDAVRKIYDKFPKPLKKA